MSALWQMSVILHGGPFAGEPHDINTATLKFGKMFIPEPQQIIAADFEAPPQRIEKTFIYERRYLSEGRIGTCEYRDWTEWHYAGFRS